MGVVLVVAGTAGSDEAATGNVHSPGPEKDLYLPLGHSSQESRFKNVLNLPGAHAVQKEVVRCGSYPALQ